MEPFNRFESETSRCRHLLDVYCFGNGLDLGSGGDPIVPTAIQVEIPLTYARVGENYPIQLRGDARNLYWFQDGVLDYVYSSHLLEDFTNTEEILSEWLRVLKPGGKLALLLPDEQRYRKHCKDTGQVINRFHRRADFSMKYVTDVLARIGGVERYLLREEPVSIYSFIIVAEKD